VNVGNVGFSAGQIGSPSLAFNPTNGQPYVAFQDWANSQKTTVMKYDYPTGIKEPQQSLLSINPNPASSSITIETPTKGHLSIMNLNGQQLLQQEITEPKTPIGINTLPSGVYFVRLTNDKTVQVGKFIKQ
jgi:hypothetical protein